MPIFLIFVLLLPIVELTLLIQVGSEIGALSTIALTLLTAAIGISLVRSQGLGVMQRAQINMAEGKGAAPEMVEGAMLAFAGLCLLIPGFLTDVVGALLLLPPLRAGAAKYVLASKVIRFRGAFGAGPHSPYGPQGHKNPHQEGNTFDGEFERKDDERNDQDRLN